MQSNLKVAGAALLILGLGVAIGRFTLPAKVITKTETVTQIVNHDVIKYVDNSTSTNQKNKVFIETRTTKPDGTSVVERKIVDKSILTKEDLKQIAEDKTTVSKTDTKTETTTTYASNVGSVRLLAGKNFGNADNLVPGQVFVYGLQVEKRFVGPISLGAFGLTDKTLGLSLGVLF